MGSRTSRGGGGGGGGGGAGKAKGGGAVLGTTIMSDLKRGTMIDLDGRGVFQRVTDVRVVPDKAFRWDNVVIRTADGKTHTYSEADARTMSVPIRS